jgi:hypothetical protein
MIDVEPELRRDYPEVYHSPVRGGAYAPAGWLPILRELSASLVPLVTRYPLTTRPVVEQVKSKLGGLRVYLSHETEDMTAAIREAERQSGKTCENCGSPAEPQCVKNWIYTLCEGCAP